MDEQIRDRMRQLGAIVNKSFQTRTIDVDYGIGSGDGHSFDDRGYIQQVEETVYVYTHPRKERREALKELNELKVQSLSDEERGEIDRILEIRERDAKLDTKRNLRTLLRGGITTGVVAVILTASGFCIHAGKVEEGNQAIRTIQNDKETIKYFESKGWDADNYRREMKWFIDYERKRIERGEIIVSKEDYQKYFAIKIQIHEEKVEEGNLTVRKIQNNEKIIKDYESKGWDAYNYRKKNELLIENGRKRIERGEIIISEEDYRKYFAIKKQPPSKSP